MFREKINRRAFFMGPGLVFLYRLRAGSMLIVRNISKYYGASEIFVDASLAVMHGDRVGIIGPNGSGKSTLLRLLAGESDPDAGSVQIEKGKRIGVLHQEVDRDAGGTAMDYILSSVRGLADMDRQKRDLLRKLERLGGDSPEAGGILAEVAAVEDRYSMEGGYRILHEAEKILAGLGFRPDDKEKDLSALSGGWRMRLELARLLLDEPDALLLDEPTNHLDIESMSWLESWLEGFGGSLVVVSHDREFLNRTVSTVVSVEDGQVRAYKGNYDAYREVRSMEIDHLWKQYNEQQARIREIEDFIARNKVRKDRAKVVQGRIRMLERMDRIVPPKTRRTIHFSFPQPARTGSPAVSLTDLGKAYDAAPVFSGLSLSILRGEKVALVGPNGSGKTTLLKLMATDMEPTAGSVSLGANVSVHYYAQHQVDALSPDLTVMEEMTSIARGETVQVIRDVLGAFLFSTDDEVGRKVRHLSGGEKSRLALAKMLLRPAGLILMDEPTNHLDIESREILEEALRQYTGTLVFVSHDRTFINALAGRVIEIKDQKASDFPGNYDYYAWKRSQGAEAPAGPPEKTGKKEERKEKEKKKKSRDRKRTEAEERNLVYQKVKPLQDEMRQIENEIEEMERAQKEREALLADADLYRTPDRVRDVNREFGETVRRIESRYARWEELNRKIEKILSGSGRGAA
jgi:ATP-binding cassette subfamily F protein 3